MNPQEAWERLKNFDFLRDLGNTSVVISNSGISFVPVRIRHTHTPEELLGFYAAMQKTREIDKTIAKLELQNRAFGKHLMSTGNEACAVGATCAARPCDWIFSGIRTLGAFVARGVPPENIIAQACGKATSPTRGWDSSLHMSHRDRRIAGLMTSHLGTMPCVATGAAFGAWYRGEDEAAISFIGDGTTSKGDVHEAMNNAGRHRLPVVFVIENNQWAFGTPRPLQSSVKTFITRAAGYGQEYEGKLIDGTNILLVWDTVYEALRRAREDKVFTIIEAVTMRMEGHSLSDPFRDYVPKEQLDAWRAKDPLDTFRAFLINERIAHETDIAACDEKIKQEIAEAEETVLAAPDPDGTNIETRVFVPTPIHPIVMAEPPADGRHITYREAIREAIRDEMKRNPDVFIIGEDIGHSGGAFKITEGFSKEFDNIDPQHIDWQSNEYPRQRRVIDAILGESGFTGMALGASLLKGLSPVVEFQYADFASEAFKMIVNCAATQIAHGLSPLHIVFRLPSGWANKASAYHCANPESWFASTPGLKIVAPITSFDAKGLFKAAIRDGNPTLFLEYKQYYRIDPKNLPRELDTPIPDNDYVVPIGKARILKEGTDCTIISYGSQIFRALGAALHVEKEQNVSIEVIDLRSLVPFDLDCLIRSIQKTSRALVTCEAPRTGCFGQTIAHELHERAFGAQDASIRLVAAADTPVPFSETLEHAHLPIDEKIVRAIQNLLAF